jgi:hypothetical protein
MPVTTERMPILPESKLDEVENAAEVVKARLDLAGKASLPEIKRFEGVRRRKPSRGTGAASKYAPPMP